MARLDKRPYLIIDACFVLNPLNRKRYEEFLETCVTLKYLKNAKVRTTPKILREITQVILGNHYHEIRAVRGLDSLEEIYNGYGFINEEKLTHRWLKQKAMSVGTQIAKTDLNSPPSEEDCDLCAYALIKLKKSDVILASGDKILKKTAMSLYKPTQDAYASIGKKRNFLEIIEDMPSLKERFGRFRI